MKKSDNVQLILLESKTPSLISKGLAIPKLFFCPYNKRYDDNAEVYQNLYILSDKKVKENDWVLYNDKPCKVVSGRDWRIPMGLMIHYECKYIRLTNEDKKIIYTTDTSLGMVEIEKEFILHYITKYNNNLIIKR